MHDVARPLLRGQWTRSPSPPHSQHDPLNAFHRVRLREAVERNQALLELLAENRLEGGANKGLGKKVLVPAHSGTQQETVIVTMTVEP